MRHIMGSIVAMVVMVVVAGCGVVLSGQYNTLLDQTVGMADQALLLDANNAQVQHEALIMEANSWHRFQDARNGVK